MNLYPVLNDPIFLSFVQPIICGLVIQWFVKRWKKQSSIRQTRKYASALIVEIKDHAVLLEDLHILYQKPENDTLLYFDVSAWKLILMQLTEISRSDFQAICSYYSAINLLNRALVGNQEVLESIIERDLVPLIQLNKRVINILNTIIDSD